MSNVGLKEYEYGIACRRSDYYAESKELYSAVSGVIVRPFMPKGCAITLCASSCSSVLGKKHLQLY